MRCFICDVELTEGEISLDKDMKSEPCTTCQQIIYETAYSGKFKQTSVEIDDTEEYGDDFDVDEVAFADLIESEVYG